MFLLILSPIIYLYFFFFNDTATTTIYTLSLHDALPISLDEDRELEQAGVERLGAVHSAHRHRLPAWRPGLVQPVPRGRPGQREPRLSRPRRGLRDPERGCELEHDRAVLELRLQLLRLRSLRGDLRP